MNVPTSRSISRMEADDRLNAGFAARIQAGLKDLLENRHLYQSTQLSYEDLIGPIVDLAPSEVRALARMEFVLRVKNSWIPSDPVHRVQLVQPGQAPKPAIWFTTPGVKLFCAQCDRIEAFNPVSAEDFLARGRDITNGYRSKDGVVQVFVFSFLCQSCGKGVPIPECFLVRRQGLRLTLSGRTPMEHVEVPQAIPKAVRTFYTGAVVAYQSGHALAGNFMLRTLIEQWARKVTGLVTSTKADEILDSYMDLLPKDFRARFPSFRMLYDELSNDMHGAVGSKDLFERAQAQIERHFDARRLFELDQQQLDQAEVPRPNDETPNLTAPADQKAPLPGR